MVPEDSDPDNQHTAACSRSPLLSSPLHQHREKQLHIRTTFPHHLNWIVYCQTLEGTYTRTSVFSRQEEQRWRSREFFFLWRLLTNSQPVCLAAGDRRHTLISHHPWTNTEQTSTVLDTQTCTGVCACMCECYLVKMLQAHSLKNQTDLWTPWHY